MRSFARNCFLFVASFCGTLSFGQSKLRHFDPVKCTFYYNQLWELTTKDKSFYRREAYFDLQDMVFDGVYTDYNQDNKLMAEGYYNHGVKTGIETEHFNDQSIKSTIEYADGDFIIWQLAIVNDKKEYQVANGTGKFSIPCYYFFDNYLKTGKMSGKFQNGKKVGYWIYYDTKNSKTDVEYYEKGKLVSHHYYRASGTDSVSLTTPKEMVLSLVAINTEILTVDKEAFTSVAQYFETQIVYPPSFERTVSYPGGLKHLLRLLAQAGVPEHNLVLIKIKVDIHGQVTKSNIVRSVDPYVDEAVLKLLGARVLRFLPAVKDGRAYVTTIYLPVSGGEEWEKTLREAPIEWLMNVDNFQ